MAKFTQQQLEDAWQQMQAERKQDSDEAELAAAWVQQQFGFGICSFVAPYGWDFTYGHWYASPYQVPFILQLVYSSYSPQRHSYENILNQAAWAVPSQGQPGFSIHEPFYTVTTPHGVYELTFNGEYDV
jgi:hypothetical protein